MFELAVTDTPGDAWLEVSRLIVASARLTSRRLHLT
jgi:hypothetical protein